SADIDNCCSSPSRKRKRRTPTRRSRFRLGLHEALRMPLDSPPTGSAHLPQPCVLVIFGGDGDLAWRKLLPAVYNLNVDGVLPSHFAVVCFGIASTDEGKSTTNPDEYIRARAKDGISRFSRQPLSENHWEDFSRGLYYVPGSFSDLRAYQQLQAKLEA